MSKPVIRIMNIELTNFKCVGHGKIELNSGKLFDKKDKSSREEALTGPDLLGIFGQNGSGKSSVIEALAILQHLMKGEDVPADYARCIAVGTECAELKFVFGLRYPSNGCFRKATYSFCIGTEKGSENDDKVIKIYNEKFWLFWEVEKKSETSRRREDWPPIIDTSNTKSCSPFDSESKRRKLIGEHLSDLRNFLAKAEKESRSFVFLRDTLDLLDKVEKVKAEEKAEEDRKAKAKAEKKAEALKIILDQYLSENAGKNANKPVVDKEQLSDLVKLVVNEEKDADDKKKDNPIPLLEVLQELQYYAGNCLYVLDANLLGCTLCEDKIEGELEKIRSVLIGRKEKINSVLSCFVPGLEIDSELQVRRDNGCLLPLQRESDGIKKLISVLSLFVLAFERPNVTVAIDNFDDEYSVEEITDLFVLTEAELKERKAGKKYEYEYIIDKEILGVLLKEKCGDERGQFIFTSHNFRPLEVIDKKFVYFTTTNKNDNYDKYSSRLEETIFKSNNLRDKYRKQIQKEIVEALKKLKTADNIG